MSMDYDYKQDAFPTVTGSHTYPNAPIEDHDYKDDSLWRCRLTT